MKPHLSLMKAAEELALLCRKIDEGAELDQELCTLFDQKKLTLTEAIDRRQAFMAELKSKIFLAKGYKKEIAAFQKKLELISKRLRLQTISLLKSEPHLPYRNSLGEKITVYSGKETLKLDPLLETLPKCTISHVISEGLMRILDIDPKYLKKLEFVVLDTDEVFRDLKGGVNLSFAKLEKPDCLRGL